MQTSQHALLSGSAAPTAIPPIPMVSAGLGGQLTYAVDELAAKTGLGRTYIFEEIRRGNLRAIRKGRRRR